MTDYRLRFIIMTNNFGINFFRIVRIDNMFCKIYGFNNFFSNLSQELEKFDIFTQKSRLGDELAEEIYTRILQEKLNVVGQKIYDYYAEAQSVDIPEFMKAKEDLLITKVKCELNEILRNGKLESLYQAAIKDKEN